MITSGLNGQGIDSTVVTSGLNGQGIDSTDGIGESEFVYCSGSDLRVNGGILNLLFSGRRDGCGIE